MDVSGGTSTIPAVLAEAAALREEARAWVAAHSTAPKPKSGNAAIAADTEARRSPALFNAMRAAHPDFAQTYTLVFRFIVELDSYEEKVFRRYLQTLDGAWRDRETWLKSQTDYAVALYRHEHPRATFAVLTQYRKQVEQSLQSEDKDFTEAAEYAKAEVERLQTEAVALRRRQLLARALSKMAEKLNVSSTALAGAVGALRAARESGAENPAEIARQLIGDEPDTLAALEAYLNAE